MPRHISVVIEHLDGREKKRKKGTFQVSFDINESH